MITLLGEPKSTQNVYKTACRPFPKMYMSKEGKNIKESYGWQLKSQWKGKDPLKGPISLAVRLYFGTKRKCDIDNFGKLLFDSMTGIIYADDSQITKVITEKFHDKTSPRIEIDIL